MCQVQTLKHAKEAVAAGADVLVTQGNEAAALATGADGAWVGTALLATPEAVEVSEAHKQRIVQSNGEDTVYTEVFDIVEQKIFGMKWPEGIASRVHFNEFAHQWHQREHELRAHLDDVAPVYAQALRQRDQNIAAVAMGQSAAFVDAIHPAADVVRSICADAERILRERSKEVLAPTLP